MISQIKISDDRQHFTQRSRRHIQRFEVGWLLRCRHGGLIAFMRLSSSGCGCMILDLYKFILLILSLGVYPVSDLGISKRRRLTTLVKPQMNDLYRTRLLTSLLE